MDKAKKARRMIRRTDPVISLAVIVTPKLANKYLIFQRDNNITFLINCSIQDIIKFSLAHRISAATYFFYASIAVITGSVLLITFLVIFFADYK